MNSNTDIKYFPNLDGLRFIGAIAILILHVESIKILKGIAPLQWFMHYHPLGDLAVCMFFVLSGFLITYLLLKEKERTETINLKGFYIKRILKIWPLYYFMIIFGILVTPWMADVMGAKGAVEFLPIALYCLFVPTRMFQYGTGAAWSVRVEEAFYLVWPLLLRRYKSYIKIACGVIVLVIVMRNGAAYLDKYFPSHVMNHINVEIRDYCVSCMAIGGMGAYLFIKGRQGLLSFLYS
ncbi:MAG TPA: acyltransferase, partial [Bacteroidia bacterium]|nr:acyltransferase [Bacteroidia bacterium]